MRPSSCCRCSSCALLPRDLPIRITAMANGQDVYDTRVIVDRIEHAIVPNTNAPEIVCSLHFPAASRTWLAGKAFDSWEEALHHHHVKGLKFPPGCTCKAQRVLIHGVCLVAGAARAPLRGIPVVHQLGPGRSGNRRSLPTVRHTPGDR